MADEIKETSEKGEENIDAGQMPPTDTEDLRAMKMSELLIPSSMKYSLLHTEGDMRQFVVLEFEGFEGKTAKIAMTLEQTLSIRNALTDVIDKFTTPKPRN